MQNRLEKVDVKPFNENEIEWDYKSTSRVHVRGIKMWRYAAEGMR